MLTCPRQLRELNPLGFYSPQIFHTGVSAPNIINLSSIVRSSIGAATANPAQHLGDNINFLECRNLYEIVLKWSNRSGHWVKAVQCHDKVSDTNKKWGLSRIFVELISHFRLTLNTLVSG